jgi:hypothetical protein
VTQLTSPDGAPASSANAQRAKAEYGVNSEGLMIIEHLNHHYSPIGTRVILTLQLEQEPSS